MLYYLLRRLLLLPLTLFCIVLVNFFIINLAPGDPSTLTEISDKGDISKSEEMSIPSVADDQYLQFREHFGLTLPILLNTWPSISLKEVEKNLSTLSRKKLPENDKEMSTKDFNQLRLMFGDQSRFVMPHLLKIAQNPQYLPEVRSLAVRFFIRGGSKQGYIGPKLSDEEKMKNRKIAKDNQTLRACMIQPEDTDRERENKIQQLCLWYEENKVLERFEPNRSEKVYILFFENRFTRYLSKVFTLDFGSLRNDPNKTVISEVSKRFKYSLTLAVLPMIFTFILCQIFGFYMALKQNMWQDFFLNIIFLTLYATPIFVVAPFLIEKIALHNHFPFTDVPIPIHGFTSKEEVYLSKTSWERIWDVAQHIALPLVAIMYGSLSAQTRLSRTAVLEVMRMDFVRTAYAKGVHPFYILTKHIGRNAAITIVTSIAGSLGVILGGSLIIETIFEINGFGRFFYEAIINRDYNVIMFSSLSGAFLSLLGYLLADITYTLLDPRITLD